MTNRPPLAFLLTFSTYGNWLHGDGRGSVNTAENIPGEPHLSPSAVSLNLDLARLKCPPVAFSDEQRREVETAIIEICRKRGWQIHALNVRTKHVHVVISGDATPERMMNDLKAFATKRLADLGFVQRGAKVWARHGSTRWLWTVGSVATACQYVIEKQGGRQGICEVPI